MLSPAGRRCHRPGPSLRAELLGRGAGQPLRAGAQAGTIAGAGHLPSMDARDRFNAAVDGCIARIAIRGGNAGV